MNASAQGQSRPDASAAPASAARPADPDAAAPPRLVFVVAMARNRVIGADGGMPWHLPDDLRRFKALTMGHAMVMGRSTFEAIGRPLPGRRTVVVTRDPAWRAEGVETAPDLATALAAAATGGPDPQRRDIVIAGGGQIYAQLLDRADRLEVTEVDAEPEGDTLFPDIDPRQWRESDREEHDGYAFVGYDRIAAAPRSSGRGSASGCGCGSAHGDTAAPATGGCGSAHGDTAAPATGGCACGSASDDTAPAAGGCGCGSTYGDTAPTTGGCGCGSTHGEAAAPGAGGGCGCGSEASTSEAAAHAASGVRGPLADASVRSARVSDAPAVGVVQAAVWRDTFADSLPADTLDLFDGPAFASAWRGSLQHPPSPQHRLLVACAGDQVVGFAAVTPATDPDLDSGCAELIALGVHPAARRAGHGSRLINAVVDTVRGLGADRLVAWVPLPAESARGLLVAAGMGPDRARRQRVVDPDGSTIMEVRLEADLGPGETP